MFDFLQQKNKLRPEELGLVLADVLASTWFNKILARTKELKEMSNLSESEMHSLWHVLLMLHCAAISVGVESSKTEEINKKIILDSFWNSVSDLLREKVSPTDSQIFENNTANWFPYFRELMLESNPDFFEGEFGPGGKLLKFVTKNTNIANDTDLMDQLSIEFFATTESLSGFAVDSVKKTAFEKSMISYE